MKTKIEAALEALNCIEETLSHLFNDGHLIQQAYPCDEIETIRAALEECAKNAQCQSVKINLTPEQENEIINSYEISYGKLHCMRDTQCHVCVRNKGENQTQESLRSVNEK